MLISPIIPGSNTQNCYSLSTAVMHTQMSRGCQLNRYINRNENSLKSVSSFKQGYLVDCRAFVMRSEIECEKRCSREPVKQGSIFDCFSVPQVFSLLMFLVISSTSVGPFANIHLKSCTVADKIE